jgi:predicted RNA-binding Zn-ribbon protein involved in translation (DUF1610 family)
MSAPEARESLSPAPEAGNGPQDPQTPTEAVSGPEMASTATLCPRCSGTQTVWTGARVRGNYVRTPYPCPECANDGWPIPGTRYITACPGRMSGVPCIAGTRIDVSTVMGSLRGGHSPQDLATPGWWDYVPVAAFEEVSRLLKARTYPPEFWEVPYVPEGTR